MEPGPRSAAASSRPARRCRHAVVLVAMPGRARVRRVGRRRGCRPWPSARGGTLHPRAMLGAAGVFRATAAVRTVNLACFDTAATQWRTGGCDGSVDEQCAPFENVRSKGQSCAPFGFHDYLLDQEDCADGLMCSNGTCVVFEPLEAGEPCTGSGSCGIQLVCREGLCLPPGALGDSCSEERGRRVFACHSDEAGGRRRGADARVQRAGRAAWCR